MDISRHQTMVLPTCFYMMMAFCLGASQYGRVVVRLGEATSPKGEGDPVVVAA